MAALNLVHFSKYLVVCSSASPKILAFGNHCLTNFLPILDCFIPNFKLKYEDSENIKANCVSSVVFNLHHITRWAFFWGGHPVPIHIPKSNSRQILLMLQTKKGRLHCFGPSF